jgi:hypothetical protein
MSLPGAVSLWVVASHGVAADWPTASLTVISVTLHPLRQNAVLFHQHAEMFL